MNAAGSHPLAVVTGASSGIGYELAKQFACAGFDVIVAAQDPRIEGAAADLGGNGVTITPVVADLSTQQGVERLYAAVQAAGGSPDAVAINAGVGVGGDFVRENDLADELKLVNLNVTSAVHLAKLLLPEMVARDTGRVLFTSSIAAMAPGPYRATYAASKAFLLSFAEALRFELRDTGITITALMPGPTETEFFERAGLQDSKIGQMDKDDPAEVARQGFEALMAGKDHVIAGSFKNKVQATSVKVMPPTAAAAMLGKLTQPQQESASESE